MKILTMVFCFVVGFSTIAGCHAATPGEEIELRAKLSLSCVTGDVFAKVVISNHLDTEVKLNKYYSGENGYIFGDAFDIYDLTSNKSIKYSGVVPELVLNDSIYVVIQPGGILTNWFNLSKTYRLDGNSEFKINYHLESFHHGGKDPLIKVNSEEVTISCRNTNPLFEQ